MTQTQVDCFLAAARTGSITKAAEELYLSNQVVSAHIRNLEREFSLTFFHRSQNGVVLSPDGEQFYQMALVWSGSYTDTLKTIQTLYQNLSLQFRIGLSEWIDPFGPLYEAVPAFSRDHAHTELSGIHASNHSILQKLEEGGVDVCVMCDTQIVANANLDMTTFAQEHLCLYLPADAPGQTLESVDPDLPHVDAAYGTWSDEETLELSRRMSNFLGLPVSKSYTMSNFHSVIACAETVPCSVVCDARFGYLRDNGHLRNIPLDKGSSLCCIWNKKNENPLLPEFVAHMKEFFRE